MKKIINNLILTMGILVVTEKIFASDLSETQAPGVQLISSFQAVHTTEDDMGLFALKHAVNKQILYVLEESRKLAVRANDGGACPEERALMDCQYQKHLQTIGYICTDFKKVADNLNLTSLGLEGTDVIALDDAGESLLKLESAIKEITLATSNLGPENDERKRSNPALETFSLEVKRTIWLIEETNKNVRLISHFLSNSINLSQIASDGSITADERAVLDAQYYIYKANIDNICAQFKFDGAAILNARTYYILKFNAEYIGEHIRFSPLTTTALDIDTTNVCSQINAIVAARILSLAQRTVWLELLSNQAILLRLSLYKDLADLGFMPN